MEQWTGSKLGKKYNKAVDCHPVCLTYMQSTSWGMLDWTEAQAGIKTAGRKINNLRYADDTTLMAEREELKSLLMKLKEESEKAGLKFKNEILYGKPQIHVFLLFLMSYHRCVIKLKHFTGKKNSTLKKLR